MATPPVYSLRIYSGSPSSSGSGPVVPTGLLYILRDIDAVCESPSGTNVLYVTIGSGLFLWYITCDPTVNPRWQGWRGRQVCYEGESVLFTAQSGVWAVNASGYQLTPP
jgi:hypothetical protein